MYFFCVGSIENPIQAGAYGETTEKSTLTADTKAVSEYQTWKESIDSGKIRKERRLIRRQSI